MAKQEKKQKRAPIPRSVSHTAEFKKSWKRYNEAGRRDMNAVTEAMKLIFAGQQLPSEYLDHPLKGDWDGARECHIGGDLLLVYKDDGDLVVFVDLGSHSELFG